MLNHDALNPHKNALNKRNAAHVHIGPDRISIKYTTNIRREETRKWLHAREVIGADIQHVDEDAPADGVLDGLVHKKNMRWIVSIYVLTEPSAGTSESGTSSLEVYQLSSFRDAEACTPLSGERHRDAAHECLEAALRVSRCSAPLNREVMRGRGLKGCQLLVIVNPLSGHKMGKALWEKVEVVLSKADVPYSLVMTKYAGHARDLVLGSREKDVKPLDCSRCSGVLVIGGDGTVSEVLNALMERPDAESALLQLVVGTVPAGSECAFAKMTTFLDPYSAAWVLVKGHRVAAIDVMRIAQGRTVMHSVCGVGWGLGGKLAEESEALRDTFGPARYLVSGIKSFVKLRGCPGRLEVLVPTKPSPLPSSLVACSFGRACDVCREPLPFAACQESKEHPLRGWLQAGADAAGADAEGSEWETIECEFVLIGILKSAKIVAPHVHLADGLVDVVAVKKDGNHLQLIKASYKHFVAPGDADNDRGGDRHFLTRKARAVKLTPKDAKDKINVDGEVLDGRGIEVRVLPRTLRCFVADLGPGDNVLDRDHKASTASFSASTGLPACRSPGRSGVGLGPLPPAGGGDHVPVTDQEVIARTETRARRSGYGESRPQADSADAEHTFNNAEYAGTYVF